MWQILRQAVRIGICPKSSAREESEPVLMSPAEVRDRQLQADLRAALGRALSIRVVDAGSCNGCELEINALSNPFYNMEGEGIHFVASPRHADLLLVTGPVTHNLAQALVDTWQAMPAPALVVAVGDCGCTGGIFGEEGASRGRVSAVIPVDAHVSGCPPRPSAILAAIRSAVQGVAGA